MVSNNNSMVCLSNMVQSFRNITESMFSVSMHYLTPGVFPEFLDTLMSCVFTASFMSNLLSFLFREATCGACIYRRSDPLRG